MRKTNNNYVFIIISGLLCITIIVMSFTIRNIVVGNRDEDMNNKSSEIVVNNKDVEIFKSESSNYISYIVEDYERNLTYSWQFEKGSEKNNSVEENLLLEVNLRLNINSDTKDTNIINDKVKEDKLIVTFDHDGKLPLNAKVRINVSNTFENGKKLYLYYYNPTESQIEYIDKGLEVKNGYVEFSLEHCSDYFLTSAIVNDAVNNPKGINYIILGLGVIVFLLIIYNIIQSKK